MRLVKSTKPRKGSGQEKMRCRIISVDLDRLSEPCDGLLITTENVLREACESLPGVGIGIARTEAQGLADVSLCLFGATKEYLTKSDKGMGAGKISIERQCMFTFGDALRAALGGYVDKSQQSVAACVVRDRRQGFAQLRFGRCEGRDGIGHKEN